MFVERNRKLKYIPGYIIVTLLAALPLFGHLSELPVQRWDESRLALAAIEMTFHKNLFVTTFLGQPDMAAMKPPLQIWLMALSIKIFGANELALRLPSAIAGLFTCYFIYWFLASKFKKPVAGVLSAAILLVSYTYVRLHGIRTGDYDGLLTLFTTIFLFYYYLYLQKEQSRHLLIAMIALTLACFAKGVAALMFLPGVFLFTLFKGKVFTVLRDRKFYIGLLVFIIIIPGYYMLREYHVPGSWKAVEENELGGRFLKPLEGHIGPWYFYLQYIVETGFVWTYLVIASIIGAYFSNVEQNERNFRNFLAVAGLGFLIVISIAGTKLDWYTMPMYPLMCVLAGCFIMQLFTAISSIRIKSDRYIAFTVFSICFLAVYVKSYSDTLDRVLRPKVNMFDKTFSVSHYLKRVQSEESTSDNRFVMLRDELEQEMVWYYQTNKNFYIESAYTLKPGDDVVAVRQKSQHILEDSIQYKAVEVDEYYGIKRYRITERHDLSSGDSVKQ